MFICRVRKSLTGPVMGIAMIFCVLLLSVCAASSTPVQVEEPTKLPVLLDTDMGSSDAMALLYLLSRADVELKVVTVAGTGWGCSPWRGSLTSRLPAVRPNLSKGRMPSRPPGAPAPTA